ncbi:MAG: hypothetical protein K0U98_24285 [Deltaproteobacteria bacterium]|nr:hypothetical protein [Deltaproteobacteria bacterium]
MRFAQYRLHQTRFNRFASAVALGLTMLLSAPLQAEPCEEPAPVDDHVEVNLGSAVPVPIIPVVEGSAPFASLGYAGHSLAFHDGGTIDLSLPSKDPRGGRTSVTAEYLGGNGTARFSPIEAMPSTTTVLGGGKKGSKLNRLPNYGGLESHSVYEGVSIRQTANSRQLRTTYEIAAGVDSGIIRLRLGGATSFSTDPRTGVLSLGTAEGSGPTLTLQARLNEGGRFTAVPLKADENGTVRFDVGTASSSRTLESVLTFSDYFHSPAATRGPNGLVAIAQATGADSGTDAVVLGLDEEGKELLWTTIVQGDGDDLASAVTVSREGRVYLTGTTTSSNFPLDSRGGRGGSNFVAELAADGSRLVGGAFLDTAGVTAPHNLVVDKDGNVLVTGRAASSGASGNLDFTTLLPKPEAGKRVSQYFLARLDADLKAVSDVATFEAADVGPPLELALDCGEVVVGYCEVDAAAVDCAHPFFEDPYSISVFGVYEDGFADTVPEGWGYHALRWKAEFKAAAYTPMVLPQIPTGLVETGDEWDLINAEANTALFPVNPGGTGPEWGRAKADTPTSLAVGAAMNMDLFQTPAYTNLHIDGSDVPAAIVETVFCVDFNAGNSLRELCDQTVIDLGLGWFQVDVVDSACSTQFAGDFFVKEVFVSDWANSTYTEGRVFEGGTEWDDAYAVTDPGTDIEIYIVDPPEDSPGAPDFTEEFAARVESHIYEQLPVNRTTYVGGQAVKVEPALAKVRAMDLQVAEQ